MKKFELTGLIRPDLLDLKPYSSARNEYIGNASIFLDANENPFDNGMNRYPDPLQKKLKSRIASLKNVRNEQLFLGNGSDECIDLLLRLLCIPGKDKVASISPSYGMYAVSAKIQQVELVEVMLNDDFSMNIELVLEKAKGCKILFLCSPNNPTGKSFPMEQLRKLIDQFEGIVMVDEAYIDFSDQGSLLQSLDEFPNLAISQTFSKAYGMAGIRLGMLFASDDLISWLNKIKLPYNVNQLTQEVAFDKLGEIELIHVAIKTLKTERNILLDKLKNIEIVQEVYPSDSNFILIKVLDSNTIYNYLVTNGVVVRNRSGQPLCDNTLRITVGTAKENELVIQLLNDFIQEK